MKKSIEHKILNGSFQSTVDLIKNYAIFTLDTQGNITSWNDGAKNIKGWEEKEVIGKYFGMFYLQEDIAGGKPEHNLRKAKQKGYYEEEGYRRRKNGQKFLADITIAPIYDENSKEHTGYIKVVKDITQRRKREDDQIDANVLLKAEIENRKKIENALKESNEELNAFASAASHDLQEPLRMIVSYLQLIERRYAEKLDQDGKDFLEFAIEGGIRMKTLINDLVEYSRIDTFGKPLSRTNASDVLVKVIDNLEVVIKEHKAKITYDTLPTITSDSVQLARVFQNLIANAIKFRSDKSPEIHISTVENKEEYIFSVTDNGKGIEAKFFNDIFVIFKQLGKRSQRQGSGVGLAIAKKIINRHRGRMWVDSTVGKGTTIFFSIPKKGERRRNG